MNKFDFLDKRINANDIEDLRNAISNISYTSRDFSSGEFDEAVRYVESKGIKLKEDCLVGELVSNGKSSFSNEDFARAVFELKKNFCQDRIDDLKKIGYSLYGSNSKPTSQPTQGGGTSPNAESHHDSDKFPFNVVAAVIAAAAVIIFLVKIVSAMRK